jgi:serine/threonine-protein kinase CHEK1
VRIAKDLRGPQVYAVKFIDKISALNGHDPKSRKGMAILHQISSEVALHRICAEHRNVIGFVATMETPVWRWIALEFAEGGDLFDKIGKTYTDTQWLNISLVDPDVGVDEDIAQFYFMQLISAMVSLVTIERI